MERRAFLKNAGLVVAGLASHNLFAAAKNQTPQSKADFTLRISSLSFDIAPAKTIHTFGYNGQVPGPLVRMKEGVPVTVDVFNDTDHEEIVHWHGQMISSRQTAQWRRVVRRFLHTGIDDTISLQGRGHTLVSQPRICGEKPSTEPVQRPVRLRLHRTKERPWTI